MDPVEIMLEEYKTLRQESLDAMKNRNTILTFGLAAIGALFTGNFLFYDSNVYVDYPFISSIMLILMIPAISSFLLLMWLGEYERSQRAGKFLVKLECKINLESSRGLLTWETHLRKNQSHMKYPYYATAMLLIGISGISVVLGLTTATFPAIWRWLVAFLLALALFRLWLFVISRISRLLRYRKV